MYGLGIELLADHDEVCHSTFFKPLTGVSVQSNQHYLE